MAIITPTRKFEGSEGAAAFGRVIKEDVRQINLRESKNKDGAWLFMLPPYKLDAQGNGKSWKVIQVRDNFGLETKESYACKENFFCPVAYVAQRAKTLFPEWASVKTKLDNKGKTMKDYPAFGRTTNKVLFNMAYVREIELGAHVLIVPQFGTGSAISDWNRTKDSDGNDKPLLNDPTRAIPILFKFDTTIGGNPWQPLVFDEARAKALPVELSDTDYLYDLDNDVIHYPTVDYLVEKMRACIPSDIFARCMEGYKDPNSKPKVVVPAAPADDDIPYTAPAPVAAIPKIRKAKPVEAAPVEEEEEPTVTVPRVAPLHVKNPMAAIAQPSEAFDPGMSLEETRQMLNARKTK